MQTKPKARIVLMGKTGQGKSTLGNQIMGVDKFKVGKTMMSETSKIHEVQFIWPGDAQLPVLLIDTPGLSDNSKRACLSDDEIINSIEIYVGSLEEGLNIGLFCWQAQSRFSMDDLMELSLIQDLLGKNVIKHLWICITQLDTLKGNFKQEAKEKAMRDLPKILKDNGFEFQIDHIMLPENENFEASLMQPLYKLLGTMKVYKPVAVEDPALVYFKLIIRELEEQMRTITTKFHQSKHQYERHHLSQEWNHIKSLLEEWKVTMQRYQEQRSDGKVLDKKLCKKGQIEGYYMQYKEQHPIKGTFQMDNAVFLMTTEDEVGISNWVGTIDTQNFTVMITKKYSGAHAVQYSGKINSDIKTITGSWFIGDYKGESFKLIMK